MLKLSKLSDYAMVILSKIATQPDKTFNSTQLSSQTQIAKPTVAKLLKSLVKSNILVSKRGSTGGYALAKIPQQISIYQIIDAIEGPVKTMDCVLSEQKCSLASNCEISQPWLKINNSLTETLHGYNLNDLIKKQ